MPIPNVARERFDTLKAILHNCVRHGPAGQNRAAIPTSAPTSPAASRTSAMLNPPRGRRLRALFDRIAW